MKKTEKTDNNNKLITTLAKTAIILISISSSLNIYFAQNYLNFYDFSKINKLKQNNNTINKGDFVTISKKKGLDYLYKCLNSLNKTKNSNIFDVKFNVFKEDPLISVIMPIYNRQNSIELSVISVLKQNMNNFEIILVNDNSKDSSLKIMKKLKKADKRIKIINNSKNMGTLYSRCIAGLNAKGKYIFSLDPDDVFMDDDVFTSITKIAEKDNYDIVEFKAFTIPNYYPDLKDIRHNFFNFHKNNLILHQPELGIFPISKKNSYFSPNDYSIWGKCIKSKIYQSSVRALGEKRYSIYDCFAEDILMIFIMFNLANSFIFVNRYGIFHLLTKTTYSRILPSNHKMFCEIFLMDIIQEFLSQNYKKFAVLKSFDVLRKIGQYKLNQANKEYLKTILQKILDCKYIKDYYKIEMKKKYSKIIKL